MNRLFAVAATTLVAALVPAGVSQASTVVNNGFGQIVFTSTASVDNNVTVSTSSGYLISDPNEAVTAGTGCSQSGANAALCTTGGVSSIRLNLGPGNDSTTVTANQNVTLYGGTGDDTLNGGFQADQIYGEDGNDTMDGGLGADLMQGGNDFDTVTYASRSGGVRVDQDGLWDDGDPSILFSPELDNVMPDVEQAIGGSGDDEFIGTSGANVFHGGDGNDSMWGFAGDDSLYGEGGNDTIDGGYDTDTVDGGLGDDTLMSRDSGVLDHVTCGDGGDSLVADREDDVAPGCESVDVPAAPTPTIVNVNVPVPTPMPAPIVDAGTVRVVTIVERTLTISPKGKIPIKISCGADQKRDCKGTITITASVPKKKKASASRRSGPAKGGKIVVAKGKFKVKRGRTALANVKASKKSLKKVVKKKSKRLNATLTVSMKNSDGSTTQILKPISLSTKNL